MFDDRLEQFSRERLDGRPLPDDLRALLEAQWAGRQEFYEMSELLFLEPGAASPILDHSYLSEQDRAEPDIMANVAAHDQMTKYFKAVAEHEDGDCYGYWMHPDEPVDRPAPIIHLDTEGSYRVLPGSCFAEACIAEMVALSGEDGEFLEMAEQLVALGVSISARSYADLSEATPVVDPADLHDELYEEHRKRVK
jgi:hypothetical protein